MATKKKGYMEIQRLRMWFVYTIEKTRENEFTAKALLQLCSPESRKTVSQDARNRTLDRKHQSFFDCLRLQISAVFSQRPICFDEDLSHSPREVEMLREQNRKNKNRGDEGALSFVLGLLMLMPNYSPSPVSISVFSLYIFSPLHTFLSHLAPLFFPITPFSLSSSIPLYLSISRLNPTLGRSRGSCLVYSSTNLNWSFTVTSLFSLLVMFLFSKYYPAP